MSEPVDRYTEPFPEFTELDVDSTSGDNSPGAASASEPPASGLAVTGVQLPTDAPPASVRRHRRSRRTVRQEDIDEFRRESLGIHEDANSPELEGAFNQARMSLSGGNANASEGANNNPNANINVNMNANANTNAGAPASGSGSGANIGAGLFNFFDNNANNANANANASPNASGMSSPSRSGSTTPTPTGSPAGGNGVSAAGIIPPGPNIPQNAGHPMDLNYLYSMVLELSDVLRNNRDMTRGIIRGAEELMRRAQDDDAQPSVQEANGEISAARIRDLEMQLAREKRRVEHQKNENRKNWELIHEYEERVGKITELIRNYCYNNESHFLAQKRQYNNLLQAEKDAHLESRLERDHWHAQTMKLAGMIRHAYRLRCQEDELPIRIVAGLQNEVRCLRNVIGLDPERPEEEYGYEILRLVPDNNTEGNTEGTTEGNTEGTD